jgi:5-methyltetrahydropteroyltriglutamate--homocysteine methyltransferase
MITIILQMDQSYVNSYSGRSAGFAAVGACGGDRSMSKQTFRTDQVGSLVRPATLLDARDAFKAGRISADDLTRAEDSAASELLARQKQVGVEIFTDGEVRRDAWQTVFGQAVDGFEHTFPKMQMRQPDGRTSEVEMHDLAANAKLRPKGRLAGVDAAFLRKHAPGPFKITLPSPAFIGRMSYRQGKTDKAYPKREDFLRDVISIMRAEMQALVRDGVAYIQLDEGFVFYVSEWLRAKQGTEADLESALAADIIAENACYDAVKGDVTVAMHICRGSRVSYMHGMEGYDWLAERLFAALNVDRYLLEYDLDYSGFEALRHVPKGKIAVLGLISSKEPQLESRDELLRRIDEAAKYCPIEQLALTTQCGFQAAADRDGAHIGYEIQWRKLELMMETARKVWG